jgi:hypothetical protein
MILMPPQASQLFGRCRPHEQIAAAFLSDAAGQAQLTAATQIHHGVIALANGCILRLLLGGPEQVPLGVFVGATDLGGFR